jgi:MtaA/CmuA family methyltransferase
MRQRVESVGKLAEAVGRTHSVLGWVEGPLAEYADLRGVERAMLDLIDKPELYLAAGEVVVENAMAFARAQIAAGADMIGIGDAAASLVGPALYRDLVLPLETRLIAAIHDAGAAAKLHICGNTAPIVGLMVQTGADVIDLDWMVPLDEARGTVGPGVTLCGNFDPVGVLLKGTPQTVAAAAHECLRKGGPRFILMPGCEVPPETPEANIRAFCLLTGS